MLRTRRSFLQASATASTLFALPPTLMDDALDSIKSGFGKVSARSAEETAKDESLWADVINAFDLEPGKTDLASIAYGRAPRVVTDAVVDTFRRDSEKCSGGNLAPGRMEAIRNQLAAYINCPPDQLAITRNTTEGVNTVLAGWKLQAGDEILTTTQEHDAFLAHLRKERNATALLCGRCDCPYLPSLQTNSRRQWKRRSLLAHA